MQHTEPRDEPFWCSTCQNTFAWGGACPHCDEPLVDVRVTPPWQREAKHTPVEFQRANVGVVLAIAAMPVAAYAAFFALAPRADGSALWMLAVLLGIVSAYWMSGHIARPIGAWLRRRNAERRRAALALTPIAAAPETGPVCVRGATRLLRAACNPDHAPSLAYEQDRREHSPMGTWMVHRSNGGEFEIDDGSGALAIVRAEHLHITGGVVRDGQLVVPLGARLEVVGDGRWEMSTSDSAVAHSRAAARVLRIEGTAERPVLLRIVDEPAVESGRSSTGVRVSPASPSAGSETASAEAKESERSSAPSASAPRMK